MSVAVKQVVVLVGVWLAVSANSGAALAQGSVTAWAGSFSPNPVASGETATAGLSASATAPNDDPYTLSGPDWSWSGGTSGVSIDHPDSSSPAATVTATFTSPGVYSFSATATATWTDDAGHEFSASGSTGTITITVVGVDKLQYFQSAPGGGGYVDVSGTLYVMVGKPVTFNAVPTPAGSSFPSGQPEWSGSSGVSGTGSTITVAFSALSADSLDSKTVVATCGNTSATANVIVYDLRPVLTPRDNFDGRDLDKWGVCEYIDLSFETDPPRITGATIGGLNWKITSGGGDLTSGTDGLGTYQCPDIAGSVSLSLLITGGPMVGLGKFVPARPIIPPLALKLERKEYTGLFHKQPRLNGLPE